MRKHKKICVLGAGNVGATIAYTLTLQGTASEIVLIDVNKQKAMGEAMDILQGTPFSSSVNIYAGDYSDAADSDIVVVTMGIGRKPGQTRIDLAQTNVNIAKEVMPQVAKYAPNAIYIVVSNPVDILTYLIPKITGLPQERVIGSGTLLDTSRLRSTLAKRVGISGKNVHAYVLGEHGDTSVIPWSLATIGGIEINQYLSSVSPTGGGHIDLDFAEIENYVRTSGAQVIAAKGATFYAVTTSVLRLCETVLRDCNAVLSVSSLLTGQYGIDDICISLPFVVGSKGIIQCITPPITDEEQVLLRKSADALKAVRDCVM